MLTNKINTLLPHPVIKHFYREQIQYNFKSDEEIMKTLIQH